MYIEKIVLKNSFPLQIGKLNRDLWTPFILYVYVLIETGLFYDKEETLFLFYFNLQKHIAILS